MKKKIINILPNSLKELIIFFRKIISVLSNYSYDIVRYFRYTSYFNDKSIIKLEAQITENYHVLEKGISMVNRKVGFGKKKLEELINLLNKYIDMGLPTDRSQIQSAIIVLKKYFEIHSNLDDVKINGFKSKAEILYTYLLKDNKIDGGSIEVTKNEIIKNANGNFHDLAFSRYSIRNFTSEEVDKDKIKNAIQIAQKTPSACNRQSSNAYLVTDRDTVQEILSIQNGNRGFGDMINNLLIVTSDLSSFKGPNERNQSFVDGGMYAMSILYSLHFQGLGACSLNWSVTKSKDKKLRKYIKISDSENVMMLIGVGNIPDKLNVAVSQRKKMGEVLTEV